MKTTKWILLIGVGWALTFGGFNLVSKRESKINQSAKADLQKAAGIPQDSNASLSNTNRTTPKFKYRLTELSPEDRAAFAARFDQKHKPAIAGWCNAFKGHVPFEPDAVAVNNLAERIGVNDSYFEYVFVVDGITLGVRDQNGNVCVDYINNPAKTKQLAELHRLNKPPTVTMPLSRGEIIDMVKAESGRTFSEYEVRIKPSGLSGGLAGGMFVEVGGTPNDGGSSAFDMVFDDDGKLVYYLKGIETSYKAKATTQRHVSP